MKTFMSVFAGLVIFATATMAGEPTAIVDEVTLPNASIVPMEFLEQGHIINLGTRGELVLGYLHSCLREHIKGGTVTVGLTQSTVEGSQITRERVECDGGKLVLTAEQAAKSGVLIFRQPSGSNKRP